MKQPETIQFILSQLKNNITKSFYQTFNQIMFKYNLYCRRESHTLHWSCLVWPTFVSWSFHLKKQRQGHIITQRQETKTDTRNEDRDKSVCLFTFFNFLEEIHPGFVEEREGEEERSLDFVEEALRRSTEARRDHQRWVVEETSRRPRDTKLRLITEPSGRSRDTRRHQRRLIMKQRGGVDEERERHLQRRWRSLRERN